jgi:phage antirepressor YoqD-like protein
MEDEIKLELVKSEEFLGVKCDFYRDQDNNIYMTREQIGQALQYSNPLISISNIHNRNKERLDKFSVVIKLISTDGKQYDTTLYTERGIYEICRLSKQPIANDFYDWVYDQITLIRKAGGVINDKELFIETYFGALDEARKELVRGFMTQIEEQQKRILEMQPKVDKWTAYMDSKDNITVEKFAKALNIPNIGRNKMFDILRKHKILRDNNMPYQDYINRGYFDVIINVVNGFNVTQTLITPKGAEWLYDKLKEWGYITA